MAFRRLGSGVLEAWARALTALADAQTDSDAAREAALGAEALARTTGATGARLPAYRALEAIDPARALDYAQLAANVEAETGLALPGSSLSRMAAVLAPEGAISERVAVGPGSAGPAPTERDRGRIRIATLGGFTITVDGLPLDLSSLKPRARLLLHLLVIHAPAAVHREVLQDALWPDADPATGARSLQVGVSAIRGVLAPAGAALVLAREGDAYRLVAPEDAIDLRRLERSIAEAREAESRGKLVVERYLTLVERLAVELLPEDGPADWIVQRREQLRAAGVAAAEAAARAALASGANDAAARACQSGLALDRYHDPLWRLLIESHNRAGDTGAASRDRRQYEAVLAGLGIAGEGGVGA
ncbi:MAG TPA: winged helix-turn-helix domain-containing protein [Solirubrobacterales bacterium]